MPSSHSTQVSEQKPYSQTQLHSTIADKNVLLARQPIFNIHNNVHGFELLYRGGLYDVTNPQDGFGITGELLNNVFTCVVDDNIGRGQPMFINIDQQFIESPCFFPSQSDCIVLEILETVPATEVVLNKIRQLRKLGFEFALDDYVFEPEREAFLPLVSIVKVDVLDYPIEKIRAKLPQLQRYNITLLAEKVEDADMFALCLEMGFTLFQGYYLQRPKLVHGTKISASRQVTLKLLSDLTRTDITVKEIADVITCDPRLALKIMLLVNSSMFSFVREIKDVKEAVTMLGIEAVKKWAIVLLLVSESQSPVEIFRTLLCRAKTLELYAANESSERKRDYFMLGLFSGLDAVLGVEMKTVTQQLTLSDELKQALNDRSGSLAPSLHTLLAIESFEMDLANTDKNGYSSLNDTYWQGLFWADELMETIVAD